MSRNGLIYIGKNDGGSASIRINNMRDFFSKKVSGNIDSIKLEVIKNSDYSLSSHANIFSQNKATHEGVELSDNETSFLQKEFRELCHCRAVKNYLDFLWNKVCLTIGHEPYVFEYCLDDDS